jgi:zinc protease
MVPLTQHVPHRAKGLFWALAAAVGLSLLPSLAAGQATNPTLLPTTAYRLKNGLQVILAEDYSLPLVSVVVTYRVGSADDPPGKAGLSYLLENLMFLGSANVNEMQHIGFINRVGGQFNASVEEDRTMFYQTVPSNHLALVLWLESDRMRSLQVTPPKVETSKTSVLEDFRRRYQQDVYADATLFFEHLLYPDAAAGRFSSELAIDLKEITAEDVLNFCAAHYVPENAVLCICGNIDKVRARDLVARYFETIPRGRETLPPRPAPRYEKLAAAETFREQRTQVPGFWLGFRLPVSGPDDLYALTILDYILLRGQSSRLYKRLWQKERLVLSLRGGLERRCGFLAYRLFATNTNEILLDRTLKAIFSELQRVKSSFIDNDELLKAKNMFRADYFNRQATTLDKAFFLSEAFLTLKDFSELPAELEKYLKVTPQLLVGLANRYFTRDNAIITTVSPR